MVQVEVTKSGGESALSVIRKFTRRVQSTGMIRASRDTRYHTRAKSKAVTKKRKIKKLGRQVKYNRDIKEGKIAEPAPRRSGPPQREQAPRPTSSSGLGDSTPIAR